jgi:hypothetical protein
VELTFLSDFDFSLEDRRVCYCPIGNEEQRIVFLFYEPMLVNEVVKEITERGNADAYVVI